MKNLNDETMAKALSGGTSLEKRASEQADLKKVNEEAKKENGGEDKGKDKSKNVDKNGSNSKLSDGSSKSKSGIAEFGKKQGLKALDKLVTDDGGAIDETKKAYKKSKKAYKQIKKIAKRMRQVARGIVRFVRWCIALGPIGWLILIIVFGALFSTAKAVNNVKIESEAGVVERNLNAKDEADLLENSEAVGNGLNVGNGAGASGGLLGVGQVNNGQLNNKEKVIVLFMDCDSDKSKSSENGSSGKVSSKTPSRKDWLTEGTQAYKNAKEAFDLWTSKGLSGEAAAGIIGWTNTEGGWQVVGRAEGHYADIVEENSLKFGIVPLVGAGYPTGKTGKAEGGGGIYQFTPYSKFADLKDEKWENAREMNEFVAKAIAGGDWNASMDMTGGNHSFEDMAKETDPEKATLMWQAYERGAPGAIKQDEKKSDAKKANEVFNKAKVKFDASKFNENFGKGKSGGKKDGKSSDSQVVRKCQDSHSGGTGWAAHKTGKVNYKEPAMWKHDKLPDDLKEYALNPESVGLKYKDSASWELLCYSYGQCTDLTANLMYRLWEKDGKHSLKNTRGNGFEVVDMLVVAFGGSADSEPRAGAAFSTGAGEQHTGVVSHVFENGDILIVEQNVAGFSGDGNHETRTWSYRYITKDHYSGNGGYTAWKFYDPEKRGYKLSGDAKAMA